MYGGFGPAPSVGHADLMPGGLQRPPPGMPQMPGGMLMGPDHRMFQNPQNLPRGGLPGARFDPPGPGLDPGSMPGFNRGGFGGGFNDPFI